MAKKRKSGKRKAPRSAAQKAATKRMLAANKSHKKPTKRRKARASKKLAVVKVTSMRSNKRGHPTTARGRARMKKRKIKGYSANPLRAKRRKHARRHNPISLKAIPQTLGKVAMPVLGGAVLSIALDKAMGKMWVPASLKVAGKEKMQMAYMGGVRIAAALAVMLVGRKMSPKHAAVIDGSGIGSMTVTVTDMARSMMPGHIAETAATHGYDQMAGYDLAPKQLAGDASGMGGYDQSMSGFNNVNSSSYQ